MVELRKWQSESIKFFFDNGGTALLDIPTGAGKTFAAIEILKQLLVKEPDIRVLIVSPTNVILDMWMTELNKNGFMLNRVGIYNATCKEYSRITLTTTASVKKINKRIFDFLIADEVHMMGSEKLLEILSFNYKYKLGLSATPTRQDYKHWEIYRIFDFKTYKYSIKDALIDGVLNKFEFYDIVLELAENERTKYDELSISIGGLMRAIGSFHMFLALPNTDPRKGRLMGLIAERKNMIWNNKKKLDIVAKLCKEYYDNKSKIIVFSEFNDTTNSLFYYLGSEGMKSGVFHSSIKQEERDQTMKRFESGDLNIILATKVLDQGLNLPSIDIGIILAGEKTTRQAIQRLGRCLRKKDHDSKLFQLYFRDTFEEDSAKERSDFYKPLAEKYEQIFVGDD